VLGNGEHETSLRQANVVALRIEDQEGMLDGEFHGSGFAAVELEMVEPNGSQRWEIVHDNTSDAVGVEDRANGCQFDEGAEMEIPLSHVTHKHEIEVANIGLLDFGPAFALRVLEHCLSLGSRSGLVEIDFRHLDLGELTLHVGRKAVAIKLLRPAGANSIRTPYQSFKESTTIHQDTWSRLGNRTMSYTSRRTRRF
jgi:hypothetical protein